MLQVAAPCCRKLRSALVPWLLSFRKYSILNFRIVTLRDTMLQSYLILKNVFPYEIQQFERLSSTLEDVVLHMYFILRAKSKRFHRKVNSRCFRWSLAVILVDPHGVSIQISIKLRETLGQITQKLCTAQTWELKKWLKGLFSTKCLVLGLFHWTISNLIFCCVTVKLPHILIPPFAHNNNFLRLWPQSFVFRRKTCSSPD